MKPALENLSEPAPVISPRARAGKFHEAWQGVPLSQGAFLDKLRAHRNRTSRIQGETTGHGTKC